jgi:mRNA interferase RelE/StbE
MSYRIKYSKSALKQLKSLEKDVQERMISSLSRVKIRPQKFVQKLAGRPQYRLRVRDYRVIMDIQNDDLFILMIKIGHRKNVYDDL